MRQGKTIRLPVRPLSADPFSAAASPQTSHARLHKMEQTAGALRDQMEIARLTRPPSADKHAEGDRVTPPKICTPVAPHGMARPRELAARADRAARDAATLAASRLRLRQDGCERRRAATRSARSTPRQ